ncbi:TlpA disulfide reductase family protein [Nocardioides sp. 1609]|uniref:TlpA family protein disulfide reductase n=1 Tax=Nocardioides sp. 1609 TaxID=2508327 RepID=UPI00106F2694|nr:TlpA disulfide reductase family protein [Nocardioides sp. 1609]
MRARRFVAAALLTPALALAAGCSGGLDGTGDANFVYGDGAITLVPLDDRGATVDIAGETLDGERLDLADLRGQVVVLNVWGSWCNPCRDEAPVLKTASEEIDAAFVGLSFRENSFENARSFEREFGIEYPTIADTGTGVLQLGRWAPTSPPTTYVLDEQGRVAALITGAVTSATTLEDLVEDVANADG